MNTVYYYIIRAITMLFMKTECHWGCEAQEYLKWAGGKRIRPLSDRKTKRSHRYPRHNGGWGLSKLGGGNERAGESTALHAWPWSSGSHHRSSPKRHEVAAGHLDPRTRKNPSGSQPAVDCVRPPWGRFSWVDDGMWGEFGGPAYCRLQEMQTLGSKAWCRRRKSKVQAVGGSG